MRIAAIVAMSENRVIGKDNKLPWHLPADLAHFKAVTTGKSIIMGRKTYESIGRPLPNRKNIVVSRDSQFQAPGCVVVNSLDAALCHADEQNEMFVIGGAHLYEQLLPRVQRLYLTIIHQEFVGDAFFPELNMHEWVEESRVDYPADTRNPYPFSFVILQRHNF